MRKKFGSVFTAFAVVLATIGALVLPASAGEAAWDGDDYTLDWASDVDAVGPFEVTVGGTVVEAASTETSYTIGRDAMVAGTEMTYSVVDTSDGTALIDGAVTPTVPGAPTAVTATANGDDIEVNWGAPTELGTPEFTSYRVQLFADGATEPTDVLNPDGSTATSATFTGVADGTYTAKVIARNGPDDWISAEASSAAVTVDTTEVPGQVTSVDAVRNGSQITVTWSAPATDGGLLITGYVVSVNGDATNESGTSITRTLPAGTHTFRIAAVNSKGTGEFREVIVNNLPPSNVVAEQPDAGIASTTITWDEPPGDPTSYEVTIAGVVQTVTSRSLTVELAPGTHSASVVAINPRGRSLPGTSNDITITIAPGAPQSVELTADSLKLTATWDAPADTGGSAIESYTVTLVGPTGTDCAAGRTDAQLSAAGCVVTTTNRSATFNVDEPGQYSVSVEALTEAGLTASTASSPAEATRAYHPFSTKEAYINQLYRDILGRNADAAGRSYWVGQLQNPDDVAEVAEAFMSSTEFGPRRPISRMYLAYLNRAPDQSGFDYWTPLLVSGSSSLLDISWGFANSREFELRYGNLSDGEFIALVYINVLGRQLDQEGYVYWYRELSKGLSRPEMMLYFAESQEFINNTTDFVDVTLVYRAMLDRSPSDAEIADLIYRMSRGLSFEDVIMEIFEGDEYESRINP